MRYAPRTKKLWPGACWRPPMEGTIRWGWRPWRWPKRASRPARRKSRSNRPTGPRRCCRRILLPTIGRRISTGRRKRETTEGNLDPYFDLILPGAVMRPSIVSVALACALLAIAPARPLEAAEFTPEQRKAIEAIVHDYMMQNPDVLIDALREAE